MTGGLYLHAPDGVTFHDGTTMDAEDVNSRLIGPGDDLTSMRKRPVCRYLHHIIDMTVRCHAVRQRYVLVQHGMG
jgi:MarR-like DNA-binding transcriptional regulator SgrR of sgrS sRNA